MEKTIIHSSERPPVITIMGHIDHGKSTLLDYIRKTNVVASEAGGITQRLSAYEVVHKDQSGKERKITFLDTPGHEAFIKMRYRGSGVADIAVLVVSAEDGVKPQTKEALECIKEYKLPYIVAITKIDKGNANLERTKQNLIENSIFLEGLGGDVPYVPISSKSGEGIPELLDMMLLVSELEELKGDINKNAEGTVIEAHRDPKRGISTTLIIKDGALTSGMYVVSGESISPVRIMENFKGEQVKEAIFSSPVQITGFNMLPEVGSPFVSFKNKKSAEAAAGGYVAAKKESVTKADEEEEQKVLPIVIKADTLGTLDAIDHELAKLENARVILRVVQRSVGSVSENDIKSVSNDAGAIVIGFNTNIDAAAAELARKSGIEIQTFDIIYKLAEWLEGAIKERTPKMEIEEKHGTAKILKTFSKTKDKQVVGGKVNEGILRVGDRVRIERGEETQPVEEVGKILTLQRQKVDVQEVAEGGEFGAQIAMEEEIRSGDKLISFTTAVK